MRSSEEIKPRVPSFLDQDPVAAAAGLPAQNLTRRRPQAAPRTENEGDAITVTALPNHFPSRGHLERAEAGSQSQATLLYE